MLLFGSLPYISNMITQGGKKGALAQNQGTEIYMDVSKNSGGKPTKCMVKIMEKPIKMDDLGGPPLFFGNT